MFISGSLKAFEANEVVKALLDNTSDGVAVLDASGQTLHMNTRGLEILGMNEVDSTKLSLLEPRWKLTGKDKTELSINQNPIFLALKSGQKQTDITIGLTNAKNAGKWLKVSALPMKSVATSQLTGIVVTFSDQTELLTSRDRLRQDDEYFQLISEHLPGMVHELEYFPDGTIRTTYASKGSKILYEVSPEEVVHGDRILMKMIDPEYLESFKNMLRRGAEIPDEQHRTWTGRFTLPSGTQKWISVRFNVHRLPNGIFRFHSIHIDVTDRIRLESELVNAAKMSALGVMAAGVAHEINNPLAIIAGRAQQLHNLASQQNLDPEALLKISEVIDRTSYRIAKIIRGLRTFARDAQNDPMEKVPLANIIEDTLAICQSRFASHGVELHATAIDPEFRLFCRPAQIGQLLLNLLNNAFDAVENSSEKKVRIEVERKLQDVEIRVIDSGPGIPPENRQRIMQPFFTTKELDRGTGLGLSIVEGLAKAHQGSVWLDESNPQTCFVVRLPLQQPIGLSSYKSH